MFFNNSINKTINTMVNIICICSKLTPPFYQGVRITAHPLTCTYYNNICVFCQENHIRRLSQVVVIQLMGDKI